jgi:cell fate regulator YaaT (PSP1 superfamily)
MSNSDDYEDIEDIEGIEDLDDIEGIDEDISSLEDNPEEREEQEEWENWGKESLAAGEDLGAQIAGVPVYRLRIVYTNETFLAAWTGDPLRPRSMVVVPTRYGRDLAQVIGLIPQRGQPLTAISRIERPAVPEDLEKAESNKTQEKEAYVIAQGKIDERNIDMKLVSVHALLEEPKLLFFFTADTRVDFRDLVKDLAGMFSSRIELRQIGVRDEARVVGGLGVCGRAYCCHAVSDKLKPVAIKMAKDQSLSLNSMKISGPCSRLLCCLAYEHLFYSEQRRVLPNEGCKLTWDGSVWRVVEVNVVMNVIRLTADDGRVARLPASAFEKLDALWTIKPGTTQIADNR